MCQFRFARFDSYIWRAVGFKQAAGKPVHWGCDPHQGGLHVECQQCLDKSFYKGACFGRHCISEHVFAIRGVVMRMFKQACVCSKFSK